MNGVGIKGLIAIAAITIATMCVGLIAIAATVKFIRVFL